MSKLLHTDERMTRPDGSAAHCAALVRSGDKDRVELAAYCGHEAAWLCVQGGPPYGPSWNGDGDNLSPERLSELPFEGWNLGFADWLLGLERWDSPELKVITEACWAATSLGRPVSLHGWPLGRRETIKYAAALFGEDAVRLSICNALVSLALELETE